MENLDNIKDKINEVVNIEPDIIDIGFISNSNNKKSKLINNSDDAFSYKLSNKYYDFQFKEPLFIEKIKLKSSSNDLKNTVLEIHDYFTNEKRRIPIDNYQNYEYISITINRVIKSFALKPPIRTIKIKLKSIELVGYSLSELEQVSSMFKKSSTLKEELVEIYETKIDELNTKELTIKSKEEKVTENIKSIEEEISEKKIEISELDNKLIELKSSIKSDNETFNKLEKSIKDLESKEHILNKTLTNLTNSIEQREEDSLSLNKRISEETVALKKLINNKNIFAYELQDFLSEGHENIKTYFWIALIPMLLIVGLTYVLFSGTVNLTTMYTVHKNMDLTTVFLSRLPFVLVISSIIFVSYEITKIFFRKVMEIHHQKLDFSKIGIIAKDVANTSFDGLDLADDEKFELRTKLKMQLLREYLSTEFHIEHDYNINKSLWSRFIEWRKQKNEKTISEEASHRDNTVEEE